MQLRLSLSIFTALDPQPSGRVQTDRSGSSKSLHSRENLRSGLEKVPWRCESICMLLQVLSPAFTGCCVMMLSNAGSPRTESAWAKAAHQEEIHEGTLSSCASYKMSRLVQANRLSSLSLAQGSRLLSATVSTRSCMMSLPKPRIWDCQ